jgi:murein tripeptide amidase MpaA
MRRALILSALLAALAVPVGLAQQTTLVTLRTTAEASDYKSTSSYEDVVRFMKAVDAASPLVHYMSYGKTGEGREMPLAVVGANLNDGSPASVLATGRLRVHIQGNIHAGEVEGKESAQALLRDLAMGRHADWLQSTVFLITPIYNADGNERMELTNRGTQNGPINGMGTRATTQGINLNRDYTKLEAPESRAFAKLWNDYDPHVGFDLHTSDGSTHAYYLTYSPPLHPNTSDAIMNLMKGEWFPFITSQVKQKHGWDMFYYGNAASVGGRGRGGAGGRGGAPGARGGGGRGGGQAAGGQRGGAAGAGRSQAAQVLQPDTVGAQPDGAMPRAWATFEHVPRFHNNYVGMRNRFALLSEAYAYATFKDRITATTYFIEEAMNYAHQNADRLKQIVAAADAESIAGRDLATRASQTTGGLIDILMGDVENITNPNNGATMRQRVDVARVERMFDRLWFAPTWIEEAPAEFYVPAAATKSLDTLRAHGITLRPVTAPVAGVEEFVITSNTAQPARANSIDFQNHELRRLEGYWRPASSPVPAGAFAVPMDQRLARLAFIMLAPTSDDGLVNWNFLDDMLSGGVYPIQRKR